MSINHLDEIENNYLRGISITEPLPTAADARLKTLANKKKEFDSILNAYKKKATRAILDGIDNKKFETAIQYEESELSLIKDTFVKWLSDNGYQFKEETREDFGRRGSLKIWW